MTPDDLKAEGLKSGNPELTDEHVAYGIRRAGEIFKAHEEACSNGLLNFRRQFPGVLHLADFQLAAIVADAYREGFEAAPQYPQFYECGICGHFHSAKWNGDCREDAARYTGDWLDKNYGTTGWSEVPMPTWEEV